MKLFIIAFWFLPVALYAQQTGIKFQNTLSWNELQKKASAEKKFIFVDCYTTWCGPCKSMSKGVFPQQAVGDFYNTHFVNVSVQLDTAKSDNDTIKQWYADAHTIMTRYGIKAFPTFLFFTPEGKIVHRVIGVKGPDDLIMEGKNALDSEKQFYSLLFKFYSGDRESVMLKRLSEMLYFDSKDQAEIVANEYINTLPDNALLSDENIKFVAKYTFSSRDRGFKIIMGNIKAFDKVIGENGSAALLFNIIYEEDVKSYFSTGKKYNWEALDEYLINKYPTIGKEIALRSKVRYYYNAKDYKMYARYFTEYLQTFPNSVNNNQINSRAWDMFVKSVDRSVLEKSLGWMKKNSDVGLIAADTDTYANLLYKLGCKEDAITWEEKAILLTSGDLRLEFLSTLEKMKTGKQTWSN